MDRVLSKIRQYMVSAVESTLNQIGLDPSEMTWEKVDLYRPEMYRTLSEEAEKKENSVTKKYMMPTPSITI